MGLNSKGRAIADAIKQEVADFWPGCEVEIQDGKTHPKAKLRANGLIMTVPFAGTPSNIESSTMLSLQQVRRSLIQMGATRSQTESTEDDQKRIQQRNEAGVAAQPNPVADEKVDLPASMSEQLRDVAPSVPATPKDDAPVTQSESLAEAPQAPPPLLPGIYGDIDAERYHADPCPDPSLSSSISKVLIEESPMHAWQAHPRLNPKYEAVDSHQFRVGRAFHSEVLGKGSSIEVLPERIKDWRTAEAKTLRDDLVAAGATPLLHHQWLLIRQQAAAFRAQMRSREELAWAMTGGAPEMVYVWEEETPYGPIYCRMMADWTPTRGVLAPDIKTTKAEAFMGWGQRTMWDTGCDIQDAFYRRGFRAHGIDIDALLFAVCEVDAPHGLMCHRVDPPAQDEADQMVQHAINMWGYSVHHGRWPGYPTETAWQSRPTWRSMNFDVRKATGLFDHKRWAEIAEIEQRAADARKEMAPNESLIDATPDNPFGLPPIGESEGTDR